MKRYTIKINKNNNNNFSFRNNDNPSKKLDDIILSNLIKMNPFLGYKKDTSADTIEYGDRIIIPNRDNSYLLKDNSSYNEFAKAANFLSNYTPIKSYYTLNDTPIAFFEDEIQIGTTLIPLYKLSDARYYKTFDSSIKNIIINLYITINR